MAVAYGGPFLGQADSVVYDGSGRITYLAEMLGTDTTHLHFYYDANGDLTTSTYQHQPNDPITVSAYQYTNGDITSEFDSTQDLPAANDTVYYTYYTDRQFAQEDYYAWQQFIEYGVVFWKSAHLLKSIDFYDHGLGYSQTIVYSFDAIGRITAFNEAATPAAGQPPNEQTKFVYPCNP